MPRKLSEALNQATGILADAGIGSARQDARLLLSHVSGFTRAQLVTESETSLDSAMQARFDDLIARRVGREPVSHLLGSREFWSLSFVVNKAVLDPRPDSETLVNAALDLFPDMDAPLSVLDLGTGSGCLLLSVLNERPHATGVGSDLSSSALEVASLNAERLGLARRARFVRGDWGAAINGIFDLILCNPPYISSVDMVGLEPEVANFEPHLALEGGEDGLVAYRRLLPEIKRLLSPTGTGIVEIGAGQAESVVRIMAECGLALIEVREDLAGIKRCIVCKVDPIFTVT
ncbi:MAG: peptide chain release factor N(5)-glutamine methyltransferase [Rhodospirillaceae bacterium]|nr:peptide chain release factor N(5)-glutamine methyltransferase [Rhodospirillaceae bacterium]MBT5456355.1 peptide chain release factor N(5)-glutamine methyltransferase [Rhodospirillaceae bacterium]